MADHEKDKWGHWERTNSEPGHDLRIFKARYDTFLHPITKAPLRATILETHPWVQIVAFTQDDHIVMVRQFRFGIAQVTLEVPAGLVEPGESHQDAAIRELREETGYTTGDWTYLGHTHQNPASHTGNVHFWMARNVERTHEPTPDEGEYLVVDSVSPEQVVAAVHDGEIRNPYTLVALSRVLDLRVV